MLTCFCCFNFFACIGKSIDAMMAERQKEKMMAKKQRQADTKNMRMAFKQQLEAQSPKVYVQEIVECII